MAALASGTTFASVLLSGILSVLRSKSTHSQRSDSTSDFRHQLAGTAEPLPLPPG